MKTKKRYKVPCMQVVSFDKKDVMTESLNYAEWDDSWGDWQ